MNLCVKIVWYLNVFVHNMLINSTIVEKPKRLNGSCIGYKYYNTVHTNNTQIQ